MKDGNEISGGKLKIAGAAIALGLIVEAATLYWSHPTAFLTFIGLGGLLVGAGLLVYLWTILTLSPRLEPASPRVESGGDATADS